MTRHGRLPLLLIVAMSGSIHAARWVNAVRGRGFRIVLFPSMRAATCPEFAPLREVRSREDAEALGDDEIGVYPLDAMRWVTEEDVATPGTYPHATAAFDVPADILPSPDCLRAVLDEFQPDLVHSLEIQHGAYLALECKRRGGASFPVWAASAWGSDIYLYRRLAEHRPVLAQLYAELDALHSDCARDIALARQDGFAGYCMPQMPASAGIDFSIFPAVEDLPPPSQRTTLLVKGYHGWAGRGLHILLALHLVAPRLSGMRIVVTHGASVIADMVERLRKEDGLDITLDPYLPTHADVMARMLGVRAVVGYGISDGISTTLLEAMATGAFMIQADTCCGDEWIADGETGLIVPPHDVVALGESIVRAMTDDGLVDAAVAINRRCVEARWDARSNGTLIAEAYRELIERHGQG